MAKLTPAGRRKLAERWTGRQHRAYAELLSRSCVFDSRIMARMSPEQCTSDAWAKEEIVALWDEVVGYGSPPEYLYFPVRRVDDLG